MAYADTLAPNRRIGTLSVVAALHVAAGYALVTGLAATFLPQPQPHPTIATNLPLPKPKPPEVKPTEQPRPLTRAPQHETRTILDPPTATFTPVIPVASGGGMEGGTGTGIGEVRLPLPDPTPPIAQVKGAKPRGAPGNWVSPNDYPPTDLRLEHTGVTRFRLSIGPDGRVKTCTVTGSSGWPGLDSAACAKLTARARFDPAIDSTGARVEGTFSSSVHWQIPE